MAAVKVPLTIIFTELQKHLWRSQSENITIITLTHFFLTSNYPIINFYNLQPSTHCECGSSLYEAGPGVQCLSSGFAQDWSSSRWSFTVDTHISASLFRSWSSTFPRPWNGQMQPWDQSGFVCVSLVFWKAFFYCTYTVIRYNIIINMKNSEGWRRRDCVFNVWTPGLLYSAAVFTPCPCNFYHNNCKIFMGQRWMCGCVEAWTRARLLLVNAKENRELLKCKDL